MRRLSGGFTVIDALTVATILGLVAALVFAIRNAPAVRDHGEGIECINNIRNLTGLLGMVDPDYPRRGGPALILFLVERGDLAGPDHFRMLFCPGDSVESFQGEDRYRGLDTTRSDGLDPLTSYAGRDFTEPRCQVSRHSGIEAALVADDSDDHHFDGYVVGYTSGAVRWRDKADDWNLDPSRRVDVGPGSAAPELECLKKR